MPNNLGPSEYLVSSNVPQVEAVRKFLEGDPDGHRDTHLHDGRVLVIALDFFDTETWMGGVIQQQIQFFL